MLASLILVAYLLGSFPSAYIAGRWLKGVDIRQVGDRNMGAMNAYRELGPWAGALVLLADVAKGGTVVLLARWAGAPLWVLFLCGAVAVVGHGWPIFLGFRGGVGAATALGVLLLLLPREMLVLFAAAIFPFFTTFDSNLSLAIIFSPLWALAWWFGEAGSLIAFSIALPVLVGLKHILWVRETHALPGLEEDNSSKPWGDNGGRLGAA